MLPIEVFIAVMYFSFAVSGLREEVTLSVGTAAILTLSMVIAYGYFCESAARLISGLRNGGAWQLDEGRGARERAGFWLRLLLFGMFILQIECLDWPYVLGDVLGSANCQSVISVLGMLPFLIMLTLLWRSLYRIEEPSTRGRWSRGGYVLFRMRYNFYVLIPWFALLGVADLGEGLLPIEWMDTLSSNGWLAEGVSVGAFLLVGITFPPLLLKLWRCQPLPAGALRDRLDELQRHSGTRFSGIYIWRIGGGVLNAAALGLIPPFRYLLISETLLERLSEEEIAGVVGHELGHLRHRHLLYYMLFILGFAAFASWLSSTGYLGGRMSSAIGICALFAIYMRYGFGYISRRFERQADLYGMELLGRSEPLVASLEKIAIISGVPRQTPCWHHASIALRVAFLRSTEDAAQLGRQHHSEVAYMKLGICFIAAGALWLAFAMSPDIDARIGKKVFTREEWQGHWQRLEILLPGDREPAMRLRELETAKTE